MRETDVALAGLRQIFALRSVRTAVALMIEEWEPRQKKITCFDSGDLHSANVLARINFNELYAY